LSSTPTSSFTPPDAPNGEGFYEITGITGEANAVAITGLQPPGTWIPGNDGYPVNNLVRIAAPQLSKDGFGYAMAAARPGSKSRRKPFISIM
jgi:hypothetical protein